MAKYIRSRSLFCTSQLGGWEHGRGYDSIRIRVFYDTMSGSGGLDEWLISAVY